jgi:hypothetical protein
MRCSQRLTAAGVCVVTGILALFTSLKIVEACSVAYDTPNNPGVHCRTVERQLSMSPFPPQWDLFPSPALF